MSNMPIPEHLRGAMSDAAKQALLDAQSAAASSNSVPRISLKGRMFRMVENGEEVRKVHERLRVIILGIEPEAGSMIKTYYAKGYAQGAKEPPTCQSDDGIAPSPWVTEKQSQTCKSCRHNVFGSATSPSGKATKACRDGKRCWVVLDDDKRPIAERTIYGLNVTVASLKAFGEYGRQLAAVGMPPVYAITELVMVDSEFPQLEFKVVGWVDADTAPKVLEMNTKRPWKISYANAGLALGMSEGADSGARTALPGIPTHLAQGVAKPPVQDVTPKEGGAPKGLSDNDVAAWD